MPKVLIVDPANPNRDGWHEIYGSSADALNGNVSRVFLTGIPQAVPTSKCRQPDNWSCGPYSMAEALGMADGEEARQWLLARGLITSDYGTEYSGIVGYLGAKGYACWYDGKAHDGEMSGTIFNKIIDHLNSGQKVILCMHHSRTTYWTQGGHYICVYDIEGGSDVHKKLDVDGKWGPKTTRKAQYVLNSGAIDGVVSNQLKKYKKYWTNCEDASWEWVSDSQFRTGSGLIRAIQCLVGANPNGIAGDETCRLLQRFLHVKEDLDFGPTSVKAFQTWLNKQK